MFVYAIAEYVLRCRDDGAVLGHKWKWNSCYKAGDFKKADTIK